MRCLRYDYLIVVPKFGYHLNGVGAVRLLCRVLLQRCGFGDAVPTDRRISLICPLSNIHMLERKTFKNSATNNAKVDKDNVQWNKYKVYS